MKTFQSLDDKDVVNLKEAKLAHNKTFTVEQYLRYLQERAPFSQDWLTGVPCEVLQQGKVWCTGKVKITMEFCPDEPEASEVSEIDLLRQIE